MSHRNLAPIELLDFDKLRITALSKAAKISPEIKEVTIGPKSPENKTPIILDDIIVDSVKPKKIEHSYSDINRHEAMYLVKKEIRQAKQQEIADNVFQGLLKKMKQKRNDVRNFYLLNRNEDFEKRMLEVTRRKLMISKQIDNNKNNFTIDLDTTDGLNNIINEENSDALRFATLTKIQSTICTKYNEIISILQSSDETVKTVYNQYASVLNAVVGNIGRLLELSKQLFITAQDVTYAKNLLQKIEHLEIKIKEEIKGMQTKVTLPPQQIQEKLEIKPTVENKVKPIVENKAKPIVENKVKPPDSNIVQSKVSTLPQFYTKHNFNRYNELKLFLLQYEEQSKELVNTGSLKKFCFDCQKAVNTPINAISSVNGSHIRDKFEKLSKLLKGEQVQVLDTYVCAAQHSQGIPFCTALLAKKIVRQCDSQISSNPEAAFPLASITVALWTLFPDLGKLIEANFHKECPYIVPMFLPQQEGQSDEDFYKSRGYKYIDGAVEKHDKFLKRMSGIFTLQCAIWITSQSKTANQPNPHGIKNAWRWLASFINLSPEPDICATMLYTFFSVCGYECYKHYGKQFSKIIKVISTDYMKLLDKIDEGGPKTRLEVLLQEILNTGKIPPPKGLLPSNTW